MALDIILVLNRKKTSPEILKCLISVFGEVEVLTSSSWIKIVLKEKIPKPSLSRVLNDVLKKILAANVNFPDETYLSVADFFKTANAGILFPKKQILLIAQAGICVEYSAYPCD